jgi:hypothetical protein
VTLCYVRGRSFDQRAVPGSAISGAKSNAQCLSPLTAVEVRVSRSGPACGRRGGPGSVWCEWVIHFSQVRRCLLAARAADRGARSMSRAISAVLKAVADRAIHAEDPPTSDPRSALHGSAGRLT